MTKNGKKGLGAIFGGSFLKLRVEMPFHGLEMKNIHKKLVKTHVYRKLKISVFSIAPARLKNHCFLCVYLCVCLGRNHNLS